LLKTSSDRAEILCLMIICHSNNTGKFSFLCHA
jgi:hypothetical protein